MVDNKGRREYRGCRCYLSPDRSIGLAIAPDGDVVSVFSSRKHKNALGKLIPFAVAAGGRKLDCFGGGLQNMYGRYGAKALARTIFDDRWAPKGWDGTSRHDIVAMSLPKTLSGVVRGYRNRKPIDLSKVPLLPDYDAMEKHRDAQMLLSDKRRALQGALGSGK